jgi:hypothetical protein
MRFGPTPGMLLSHPENLYLKDLRRFGLPLGIRVSLVTFPRTENPHGHLVQDNTAQPS